MTAHEKVDQLKIGPVRREIAHEIVAHINYIPSLKKDAIVICNMVNAKQGYIHSTLKAMREAGIVTLEKGVYYLNND